MGGRVALIAEPALGADLFQMPAVADWTPRYNSAPTQPVLTCRLHPERQTRERAQFRGNSISLRSGNAPTRTTGLNDLSVFRYLEGRWFRGRRILLRIFSSRLPAAVPFGSDSCCALLIWDLLFRRETPSASTPTAEVNQAEKGEATIFHSIAAGIDPRAAAISPIFLLPDWHEFHAPADQGEAISVLADCRKRRKILGLLMMPS
jgi:hypothetical protein